MEAKFNYHIEVAGIVQGVGFRPFVHNLAKNLKLTGWVNNTGSRVVIEAEGTREALDAFVRSLKEDAPLLSQIKEMKLQAGAPTGYKDFDILESIEEKEHSVFISPDVATCGQCTKELFDKTDRRYMYPFINCTNCGPRFTIVEDTPYDRINTTMKVFPMCPECKKEYTDPVDRRYHAQPVSCFDCGPQMQLLDKEGVQIYTEDMIGFTAKVLAEGKIVALKGLGGYHLVCDANNSDAVRELRRRKIRDEKPFAVMAADYETASQYCYINPEEKTLLSSVKRPIVLLKKKEDCNLPEEIAPSNPYLGVMLPYTPVHLLLFACCNNTASMASREKLVDVVVMTSGNRSSEPIYYKDQEALDNLKGIADYFLLNNREIHTRVDDTVTRVFRGKEYIIRRSRGYVPTPVTCKALNEFGCPEIPTVLAAGGELKSTFCLNRGDEFYMSAHIGNLENYETLKSYEEGIEHFKKLFNVKPETAAYDLHPEYLSTKFISEQSLQKLIPVQHHHAHIASCMADNDMGGDVIGVAFDGTGYGEDGNLWGGEFFTGGYRGFIRHGRLEYIKMPGGEAAIREPWRMAAAYLYHTFGKSVFEEKEAELFLPEIDEKKLKTLGAIIERNINTPLTSSMGRLFDAVSALLGIRNIISYEGQAAIELERAVSFNTKGSYEFGHGSYEFDLVPESIFIVDVRKIIKGILKDRSEGKSIPDISARFHNTAGAIVLRGCEYIREKTGLSRVCLSGGVFQNITLLNETLRVLEIGGFEVYTHSRIPANDGGIALGQAVMAIAAHNNDVHR